MDKEEQMFRALGYGDFIDDIIRPGHLNMMDLYDIAVKDCFSQNSRGKAVASLRRTFSALRAGVIYRCTPEFDRLIRL